VLTLAFDTATSVATAALVRDGEVLGERASRAVRVLEDADELLREAGARQAELTGIVVGTGPGSFTGLRVGLATAKTIAYARRLPLVGVPTAAALARAGVDRIAGLSELVEAGWPIAVLQPAGPSDRYLSRVRVGPESGDAGLVEPPRILSPAWAGELTVDPGLVAVDLDDDTDLPESARSRGRSALEGLGVALSEIGSRRLERGESDDVAALVPVYVTLPRGVIAAAASVEWSPDLR
jgi:tRNA threonylcarbamoyl adenosine modification protein YeaZ